MLKALTFDLWWTLIKETPEGSHDSKEERICRSGNNPFTFWTASADRTRTAGKFHKFM